MSILTTKNVRIAGMSACVPSTIEENIELPIYQDKEEAEKIILSTGIERHRRVKEGTTASDLAFKAINELLKDLKWDVESVDCLFYVSQSRDYTVPQTSCILQDRLHLRNDCFVMDLPIGCAGWVYGMSVATAMMSNGTFKRGLLVNAETNTLNRSMRDRSVRPLFGDAAAITALEYDKDSVHPMNFNFGVDGSGADAIMAKYGGTRYPITEESLKEVEVEPGIFRSGIGVVQKSMDVFGFAIKWPPRSLKELISTFDIDTDKIDYLFLHQANKYIDERIRKSLKFPVEKVPYCLSDFGNVSGASIPLTMVVKASENLSQRSNHCLACGFGVGLLWASIEFYAENVICTQLIEY